MTMSGDEQQCHTAGGGDMLGVDNSESQELEG